MRIAPLGKVLKIGDYYLFVTKTKSITVRLSEEEYKSLFSECVAVGARSVSDYARDMLFRQNRARIHRNPVAVRLSKLDSEVVALGRKGECFASDCNNPSAAKNDNQAGGVSQPVGSDEDQ